MPPIVEGIDSIRSNQMIHKNSPHDVVVNRGIRCAQLATEVAIKFARPAQCL